MATSSDKNDDLKKKSILTLFQQNFSKLFRTILFFFLMTNKLEPIPGQTVPGRREGHVRLRVAGQRPRVPDHGREQVPARGHHDHGPGSLAERPPHAGLQEGLLQVCLVITCSKSI